MKWLADENFDNDILRGIRRRVTGFDVVRAQDIAEISGLDDPAVLGWATTNDRVVLTHDVSTMIPAMMIPAMMIPAMMIPAMMIPAMMIPAMLEQVKRFAQVG